MSDNLTIQGFNSLFFYTMCEGLQAAYDVTSTLLSLFQGFSFALNNLFLKIWFDNRKMMQPLQLNSGFLGKKLEI